MGMGGNGNVESYSRTSLVYVHSAFEALRRVVGWCCRVETEGVGSYRRDVDGRRTQSGSDAAARRGSTTHQLHRTTTLRRHRRQQENRHQDVSEKGTTAVFPPSGVDLS